MVSWWLWSEPSHGFEWHFTKLRGTNKELLGWREHLRKAFSDHLSSPFGNPEEGGLGLDLD